MASLEPKIAGPDPIQGDTRELILHGAELGGGADEEKQRLPDGLAPQILRPRSHFGHDARQRPADTRVQPRIGVGPRSACENRRIRAGVTPSARSVAMASPRAVNDWAAREKAKSWAKASSRGAWSGPRERSCVSARTNARVACMLGHRSA